MESPTNRRNRGVSRRKILLALVLLLVATPILGWLAANRIARQKLEQQLTKLDLGHVSIGQVHLTLHGIRAADIELRGDQDSPIIRIGQFRIQHPISSLLNGAEHFERLELDGLTCVLSADSFSPGHTPLDITQLSLPADKVIIERSEIRIQQSDTTVIARDLALEIVNGETVQLDGRLGDFANSSWNLSGSMIPRKNAFSLELESALVELETAQWSQWPWTPKTLPEILEIDGQAAIELQVQSAGEGTEFSGSMEIRRIHTLFRDLDLPLIVANGVVQWNDKKLEYQNLIVNTPDGGECNLQGSTQFEAWPVQTQFSGSAKNVSANTIRRLVPDLPEILQARVSGPVEGSVGVDSAFASTIQLNSHLQSDSANYGSIGGSATATQIQINKLTFDKSFDLQTLQGTVNVESEFEDLPLDDIFATFEIVEAQKILGLDGRANGSLDLTLPLETIHQVATWNAKIQATAPQANLASQSLHHVKTEARLESGILTIQPTAVTKSIDRDGRQQKPVADRQRDLSVKLQWPLVDNTLPARLLIDLEKTSLDWSKRVTTHLVTATSGESVQMPDDFGQVLAQIQGSIRGKINAEFSAVAPDQLKLWKANARLAGEHTSSKTLAGEMDAELSLNQSVLRLDSFQVKKTNRPLLTGTGLLNLARPAKYQLSVEASQISVNDLASLVETTGWKWEPTEGRKGIHGLDGDLDVSLQLTPRPDDSPHFQWAASSNNLSIANQKFAEFNLQAESDLEQIHFKSVHAKIDVNRDVVDAKHGFQGSGNWNWGNNSYSGGIEWSGLPLSVLATFMAPNSSTTATNSQVTGLTSGQLRFSDDIVNGAGQGEFGAPDVEGSVTFSRLYLRGFGIRDFAFAIDSTDQEIIFNNSSQNSGIVAKVQRAAPFSFRIQGSMQELALSQVFQPESVLDKRPRISVTGAATGKYEVAGQIAPLRWNSAGQIQIRNPSANLISIKNMDIDWNYPNEEGTESTLNLRAFGGKIQLVDASKDLNTFKLNITKIDVREMSSLLAPPFPITGNLDGVATLSGLNTAPEVDLVLKSTSLSLGPKKFGDFLAQARYENSGLSYRIEGGLLGGKLTGEGSAEFPEEPGGTTRFPVNLKLNNGTLRGFYAGSDYFRALRPLQGKISADANLVFAADSLPQGSGRLTINDVQWNRKAITREASLRCTIQKDRLVFDDAKVDLKRGRVVANVVLPFRGQGQFQIDVRQFDLRKLANLLADDLLDWDGLVDSRLNGRIGNEIEGQGFVAIDQANLHGVTGQSAKLPIRFKFSPRQQRGNLEFQRSRFRLFDGTVAGAAEIQFGRQFDFKTDLRLANINTGDLIESISDFNGLDQGQLSGRFKMAGHDVRTARDLKGSFTGKLDRASAFQLPVLEQVGRFLSTGNLNSRDFESDEIRVKLNRGRVQIDTLNLANSIARIAINGSMYLDGRLDLLVTARVEQLNQPTLIDELLGSPLARFSGSPTALAARAADFLSERVAFLRVGGNLKRPQIRVDSGRQIQQEVVRYFLRDSSLFQQSDDQ